MRCPQCGEKFDKGQEIFGRVVNTCICGCRVMTDAKKAEGPRMTEAEVLTRTLEDNGPTCESIVAIEEMGELTKELTKDLRDMGNFEHIAEEMADVEICLAMLKIIYDNAENVREWKAKKLKRLEDDLMDM